MLSLTKPLGNELIYKSKKYKLDLSFDIVLSFYEMLDDERLSDSDKVMTSFEMFLGYEPNDADFTINAFKQIGKYISMKPYGNDVEDAKEVIRDPRRLYSFQQDAEAIYSSFYEQYGIDLIDVQGQLHWDKFKALFQGLGPNTYLQRIIDIRTRNPKDYQGEALAKLTEAKQYYELDINKTQKAKEAQFANLAQTLRSWATS